MRRFRRKSAPRVQGGLAQRKNNWRRSAGVLPSAAGAPAIVRERPGQGYRHLLRTRDVERFLALLPDWGELSRGLRGILLAEGCWSADGWHRPGVVALCAWEREIACVWGTRHVEGHRPILERLGVETELIGPDDEDYESDRSWTWVGWTEASARGYQLMHILLHELGHHHDRMTTRSQRRSARGESFAEAYALQYAERLWDRYFDAFGW